MNEYICAICGARGSFYAFRGASPILSSRREAWEQYREHLKECPLKKNGGEP